MADTPKVDAAKVEQEVSWIGARLREKSTYAGLTVVVSLALPFLSKYVPQLADANAGDVVDKISALGVALGGVIAIVAPEKTVAKFVAMLALCILGASLLAPVPSQAAKGTVSFTKVKPLSQIIKPTAQAAAPATPEAPTSGDPLADLMAQLEKVQVEDVAAIIVDINAADVDAGTVVTPEIPGTAAVLAADGVTVVTPAVAATPAVVKDAISHACYPASVKFLQSLPVAAKLTGKFVGVQLFQKKRDFVAQLRAGLPTYLKLGCMPLLGDEINTFIQMMVMVGIKILPAAATALMPALAPITLPAMTLAP